MAEERTPLNAPGPFYVARDQCITCMAPEAEAPSLMAFDEERSSCYFRRQPETADETYRAIRAVWVSCCGAVRYGGTDPAVVRRLVNLGLEGQVDEPAEVPRRRVVRDRATFRYVERTSARELAAEVGRRMRAAFSYGTVSDPEVAPDWASIVWTWAPGHPGATMKLVFRAAADDAGHWVVYLGDPSHPGAPSVATSVDDALRATERVDDVRWYTPDEWDGARHTWSPLPI